MVSFSISNYQFKFFWNFEFENKHTNCPVRDIKNRILQFSNCPILEFKVLHKTQRAFKNPFLMVNWFLFITLKAILSLVFLNLKRFCSALNSRIGELDFWCHEQGKPVMGALLYKQYRIDIKFRSVDYILYGVFFSIAFSQIACICCFTSLPTYFTGQPL